MESAEHQEWRSRQHLSLAAVFKAAFAAGAIFYVMTGGSPWSTAGTMNAVMGRDIPIGNGWAWMAVIAGAHFALALLYTAIIGGVIYRFRTHVAVPLGIVVGAGLYLVNVFVFRASGLTQQSPEFRPIMVHFMFALFASLCYKALSVPPPLTSDES